MNNLTDLQQAPDHAQEYSYWLIDIEWSLRYDFETLPMNNNLVKDETVSEDSYPLVHALDENGIPMGKSMEEIRQREALIDAFFRNWYEAHPIREVFNSKVNDNILIRKVSIDEAKQHASKNYLSTLALIQHFDEILANAESIGKTAVKKDDRNQSQFDYMLIMSYDCEPIGVVKLTVGIKKKKNPDNEVSESKTEYGISVVPEGQTIVIPKRSDKRKKKAPHRK